MATDCTTPKLDARGKQQLRRRLLSWYAKHQRDLPWRRSKNAYRVWVSEVMLQQTQVATVKDYFRRFVKAFPTVKKLAAADEQEVLRLWEGLGYYRRARQLHAAAQAIVDDHNGRFPRDVETLQTLPGIGRYTAGAIVSIAFDQPAPILEANTIRLLSRLIAYREDPTKSAGQRLLWQTAEQLLPTKDVAQFNQALMELGSLVCTPVAPSCGQCPVAQQCAAYDLGLEGEIPISKRKLKFVDVHEAAVVVRKQSRILIRQCAAGERWAGLWDFPRFAIENSGPLFVQDELAEKVCRQTGIQVKGASHLQTLKHGVTRYRITLDCYQAEYVAGRIHNTAEQKVRWIATRELAELPLSTTGRKLANLITG